MKPTTTKAEPTESSATPQEREALRALAEQVLMERLTRCTVVGHTASGRVKVVHGEPGPATRTWFSIQEQVTR